MHPEMEVHPGIPETQLAFSLPKAVWFVCTVVTLIVFLDS